MSKENQPTISMSNTKKEMIEAFKKLESELRGKEENKINPEQQKAEQKKVEIEKKVEVFAENNVEQQIGSLKVEMIRTLDSLSEKLEREVSGYNALREAIDIKNKELKDIYGIENSAYALASLIEAHKLEKETFEKELLEKRREFEHEMTEKKAGWEKEKAEMSQLMTEQKEAEKKQRDREKEEYLYSFEREKSQNRIKLEDEISVLEKTLAQKKEDFEKDIAQREKEIKDREQLLKDRERTLDSLQKQVDSFPAELDKQVMEACNRLEKTLKMDAEKVEAIMLKEYEGKTNVFLAKIEALESTVKEQKKQIEELSSKLELSYTKVQDIAVKAIEGQANSKHMASLEKQLTGRMNPGSSE